MKEQNNKPKTESVRLTVNPTNNPAKNISLEKLSVDDLQLVAGGPTIFGDM